MRWQCADSAGSGYSVSGAFAGCGVGNCGTPSSAHGMPTFKSNDGVGLDGDADAMIFISFGLWIKYSFCWGCIAGMGISGSRQASAAATEDRYRDSGCSRMTPARGMMAVQGAAAGWWVTSSRGMAAGRGMVASWGLAPGGGADFEAIPAIEMSGAGRGVFGAMSRRSRALDGHRGWFYRGERGAVVLYDLQIPRCRWR